MYSYHLQASAVRSQALVQRNGEAPHVLPVGNTGGNLPRLLVGHLLFSRRIVVKKKGGVKRERDDNDDDDDDRNDEKGPGFEPEKKRFYSGFFSKVIHRRQI